MAGEWSAGSGYCLSAPTPVVGEQGASNGRVNRIWMRRRSLMISLQQRKKTSTRESAQRSKCTQLGVRAHLQVQTELTVWQNELDPHIDGWMFHCL